MPGQHDRAIDLRLGQPDYPTPAPVKEAACRAIAENWTRYTPQPGFVELGSGVGLPLTQQLVQSLDLQGMRARGLEQAGRLEGKRGLIREQIDESDHLRREDAASESVVEVQASQAASASRPERYAEYAHEPELANGGVDREVARGGVTAYRPP